MDFPKSFILLLLCGVSYIQLCASVSFETKEEAYQYCILPQPPNLSREIHYCRDYPLGPRISYKKAQTACVASGDVTIRGVGQTIYKCRIVSNEDLRSQYYDRYMYHL